MFIMLPDSPVTAKGLSQREKRVAVERLRENQTGVENKVRAITIGPCRRQHADYDASISSGEQAKRRRSIPRHTN